MANIVANDGFITKTKTKPKKKAVSNNGGDSKHPWYKGNNFDSGFRERKDKMKADIISRAIEEEKKQEVTTELKELPVAKSKCWSEIENNKESQELLKILKPKEEIKTVSSIEGTTCNYVNVPHIKMKPPPAIDIPFEMTPRAYTKTIYYTKDGEQLYTHNEMMEMFSLFMEMQSLNKH